MPIPPSAPPSGISFSQIQEEFGQGPWLQTSPYPAQNTTPISLNEYYGSDTGIPDSGQISVSNFLGKSRYYSFSETVSANTSGYNVYQKIAPLLPSVPTLPSGQKKAIDVTITINSNRYISHDPSAGLTGSLATSQPGQHSSWPANSRITIINNGFIVGQGGAGGAGGTVQTFTPPSKQPVVSTSEAVPGSAGGTAFVNLGIPTRIINNGTIGGGGGGGGGAARIVPIASTPAIYRSAGGGGGRGLPSSGALRDGTAGTLLNFGLAGPAGPTGNPTLPGTLAGGPGGDLGSVGVAGANNGPSTYPGGPKSPPVAYTYFGGSGGAPGAYISGASFTVFPVEGTRLGTSS